MIRTSNFSWLLALVLTFGLVACKAANPVGAAETVEQRAYAIYGTYVIFAEQAADLVEGGTLPTNVSLRVIQAEERTGPALDAVMDAVLTFERLRDNPMSTGGELLEASNRLAALIDQAVPLVNDLVTAVKGAR